MHLWVDCYELVKIVTLVYTTDFTAQMHEIWRFLMQGSSCNKRQGIRKTKRAHIGKICWGYRPCLRVKRTFCR